MQSIEEMYGVTPMRKCKDLVILEKEGYCFCLFCGNIWWPGSSDSPDSNRRTGIHPRSCDCKDFELNKEIDSKIRDLERSRPMENFTIVKQHVIYKTR